MSPAARRMLSGPWIAALVLVIVTLGVAFSGRAWGDRGAQECFSRGGSIYIDRHHACIRGVVLYQHPLTGNSIRKAAP